MRSWVCPDPPPMLLSDCDQSPPSLFFEGWKWDMKIRSLFTEFLSWDLVTHTAGIHTWHVQFLVFISQGFLM